MEVVLLKLMTQIHKKAGTNFDTDRKFFENPELDEKYDFIMDNLYLTYTAKQIRLTNK